MQPKRRTNMVRDQDEDFTRIVPMDDQSIVVDRTITEMIKILEELRGRKWNRDGPFPVTVSLLIAEATTTSVDDLDVDEHDVTIRTFGSVEIAASLFALAYERNLAVTDE